MSDLALSLPLIHADWTRALWAALMLLAALGFWVDKTRLGKSVSGAAVILISAMTLSNLGVLPRSSDVYGVVWAYLVPLAIPLLLLKADLRRVISETRFMLLAFAAGAVGTILGTLVGFFILPLGAEGHELAGVFSATYIGGSMNMAAVSQAVSLDPTTASAAVAADNVVGVLYLTFLALAPSLALFQWWFRNSMPSVGAATAQTAAGVAAQNGASIDLRHIGFAVGLAFAICALGNKLAEWCGVPGYGIMFITALTLALANLFPRQLKSLRGEYEVGLFCMYLFFAAVGISADVLALLNEALVVAAYAAVILLFHAAVTFGVSRYFKLDLMEVVIASNACAGGPASAAALAAGKDRPDLVAPAVLLGVLGYAIANFIGIGLSVLLTP
jgi:uncharacterized membrane protein